MNYEIREVRVRTEPKRTVAHVLIEAAVKQDGITGWHEKEFPKGMTACDVTARIETTDPPVLWPMATPETLRAGRINPELPSARTATRREGSGPLDYSGMETEPYR